LTVLQHDALHASSVLAIVNPSVFILYIIVEFSLSIVLHLYIAYPVYAEVSIMAVGWARAPPKCYMCRPKLLMGHLKIVDCDQIVVTKMCYSGLNAETLDYSRL